jgi:radical SAM superfamily enzyme YgiQ (UPF0313 family)
LPDILLIQPPIRDFYLTAKRTIPYGLSSIAASLIRHGFSVEILDALATKKNRTLELPAQMAPLREFYPEPDLSPFALFYHFRHYGLSFRHIEEAARSSGAYLVGISALFTPYIGEALETAVRVKTACPDCKIVLGGHHPTQEPESVMQCQAVDFVLRGEGEFSMPMLAKSLKGNLPIASVPGIVYRKGGIVRISEPAILDDLDCTPPPAMDLVRHSFYRRGNRGSIAVVASRGCPMTCSYCSVNAGSCYRYRRRSVRDVLQEIETAVTRFQAGFIDFEDENLSLDRKWFLTLLDRIAGRFAGCDIELRAMNGLYPPALDREIVFAMKKAGFRTLNLSLGTTAGDQLKRFRRQDVTVAFESALHLAETAGMGAVGYIIVGAPFQSAGDSIEDLLFLACRRVLPGVSIFYPSPGSADYALCRDLGLLPGDFSLMRSTAFPISHTTTREEAATLLRLGRILNFIKHLKDERIALPEPEGIRPGDASDPKDRLETGKRLLAGFLHDGKIRGMRPDGSIFEHRVSEPLAGRFLDGLRRVPAMGWKGCGSARSAVAMQKASA